MSQIREFLLSCYYYRSDLGPYYADLVERFVSLGLADIHYAKSVIEGGEDSFWERIWEAILGCHLADLGFAPKSADEGPDFLCNVAGQRVWVEAICPRPKGFPETWLNREKGGVYTTPGEALTLNWTAALKAKRDKLAGADGKDGYVAKGIVSPDDIYVIAVNSSRLGGGMLSEFGFSQFPYSAEVGLGIGPMAIPISRDGEFGEAKHTTRFSIKNSNSADVDTAIFLGDAYAGVSAVLSTGHLCPQPDTFPFVLVHNPMARAPLSTGSMGDVDEFASWREGDEIVLERLSS